MGTLMQDIGSFRFLVTGGAGFIGSSLVEELIHLKTGGIRVLDNMSTGKRSNLAAFETDIELVEGDLRNYATVERCMEDIDYVLHQGALPSVPRSVEDPLESVNVNIGGTANVLTAAAVRGVRRVVFASSSSVYGDTEVLPKHEGMPLKALSPYAASKGACELLCESFNAVKGLETVSLRYFNIFGPRQDPTSMYSAVIPRFVTAVKEGKPVPVFGDGLQTRDFTYVGNVVEANLLACVTANASGQRFNIGCGDRISLLELASAISDVMGMPMRLEHLPPRTGDVRHSQADISRARDVLGYSGSVSLRTGLEKTVAFFLDQ